MVYMFYACVNTCVCVCMYLYIMCFYIHLRPCTYRVAVIHVPLSFSYDYKEIRSDSFGILREIVSNKVGLSVYSQSN